MNIALTLLSGFAGAFIMFFFERGYGFYREKKDMRDIVKCVKKYEAEKKQKGGSCTHLSEIDLSDLVCLTPDYVRTLCFKSAELVKEAQSDADWQKYTIRWKIKK